PISPPQNNLLLFVGSITIALIGFACTNPFDRLSHVDIPASLLYTWSFVNSPLVSDHNMDERVTQIFPVLSTAMSDMYKFAGKFGPLISVVVTSARFQVAPVFCIIYT